MTVDQCVNEIVDAMAERKREWVMTAKGRLGLKLKPFVPAVIDKMAKDALDDEHGGKQSA